MHVRMKRNEFATMIPPLEGFSSPNLQNVICDVLEPQAGDMQQNVAVLSSALRQSASLKLLRATECKLGETMKAFSMLIHLDLQSVYHKPSTTEILDIIALNAQLQTVRLHFTALRPDDPVSAERLVPIPNLRVVSLLGVTSKAILAGLCLPRGCHLNIGYPALSQNGSTKDILPDMLTHLTNLKAFENISVEPETQTNTCRLTCVGPNGSLSIRRIAFPDFYYGFPPISLESVRDLRIRGWEQNFFMMNLVEGSNWARSQSLERVSLIRCNSSWKFLEALEGEGGSVLFPRLQELVLFDDPDGLQPSWYVGWLRMRKLKGMPLKCFKIICHSQRLAHAPEAMKLKEFVSKLKYKVDDKAPEWPYMPVVAKFPTFRWVLIISCTAVD